MENNIVNLKLHQTLQTDFGYILRVINGWIYVFEELKSTQFVPENIKVNNKEDVENKTELETAVIPNVEYVIFTKNKNNNVTELIKTFNNDTHYHNFIKMTEQKFGNKVIGVRLKKELDDELLDK